MSLPSFPAAAGDGAASLPFLAYRDPLTQTANRLAFDLQLAEKLEALARGFLDNVTTFFLDLDRFKAVNDTLGHAAGDCLLRTVAERLLTLLPVGATLARLGGDEFGILLLNTTREASAILAAAILDLVGRAYLIEGSVIHIGVSIGIASAPDHTNESEHLLKYADLALYHSKAQGRGSFHFFHPEMEVRAQQRRTIELDLRKALALRQFVIHYQPQIDAEKGMILALEGLLHWRHPQRGLLAAADFLEVAQEIGLGNQIGEWMLRAACKEAARWPAEIKVAVNISAVHFEAATFADAVESALSNAGLPGSRLEIGVTEDILLRKGTLVIETLQRLRALDVRVAMDSFGTGFASLSQLVNFPFDKIKIDRSLTGLGQNDMKSRAIVQAISALGRTLGITTLAEGVEDAGQLADVRADGCHALGGFYCSTARPAADLESLFLNESPNQPA